jgi:uncharacterized small protein (DUF1192 family)
MWEVTSDDPTSTGEAVTDAELLAAMRAGVVENVRFNHELCTTDTESLTYTDVGDLLYTIDHLRAEIERLRAALTQIAQYDPRWHGQKVNDAPNRQHLIERAFLALAPPIQEKP